MQTDCLFITKEIFLILTDLVLILITQATSEGLGSLHICTVLTEPSLYTSKYNLGSDNGNVASQSWSIVSTLTLHCQNLSLNCGLYCEFLNEDLIQNVQCS